MQSPRRSGGVESLIKKEGKRLKKQRGGGREALSHSPSLAPVTRALLQAKTLYLYYRINFSCKVISLRSCLHGLTLLISEKSINGHVHSMLKILKRASLKSN